MEDVRMQRIRELIEPLRVPPGSEVVLERDYDPADTRDLFSEEDSKGLLAQGVELLRHYQSRLAPQDTYGVLVVLQALDAGGKDSTIRHVMSGVNPQGVVVHGFRKPSADELDHDYLWRYAQKLPARGQIGIFNRSHYEDVLVVRVHPELLERQQLPPSARGDDVWERRHFPTVSEEERTALLSSRATLEADAPPGAAADPFAPELAAAPAAKE